jgi:hypothetical protein
MTWKNLPLVLTLAATTGINDMGKFAAGFNYTGGKFATSINNTGGKFAGVIDTGGKFATGVNNTDSKYCRPLTEL